jgi:hypothetical protein
VVKKPRIAPSMVSYAILNTYVVARIDIKQWPFGDRVGEANSPGSRTGLPN